MTDHTFCAKILAPVRFRGLRLRVKTLQVLCLPLWADRTFITLSGCRNFIKKGLRFCLSIISLMRAQQDCVKAGCYLFTSYISHLRRQLL